MWFKNATMMSVAQCGYGDIDIGRDECVIIDYTPVFYF